MLENAIEMPLKNEMLDDSVQFVFRENDIFRGPSLVDIQTPNNMFMGTMVVKDMPDQEQKMAKRDIPAINMSQLKSARSNLNSQRQASSSRLRLQDRYPQMLKQKQD